MKKINYRLIVSDFDGTLITSNQEVLPEVKNAISNYVSNGGIFAVCTGRMLVSILPRVRELGLKGFVIAQQGAVIADIESGEIIKNSGLTFEETSEVCVMLEELGQAVNVYSGDSLYTNIPEGNPYLQLYERIIGVKAMYVGNKISEFVRENKLFCQKVASLIMPKDRDNLYIELCKKFDGKYDVTCSARELVEVSKLGENKGAALKYIAARYNVPINLTVAAGDNLNDLSMVEAAGIGVAVGNADEKLKSVADFVSVTNNDGAIAQIINKYGFA